MEKKVNRMVEIAEQSEAWRKNANKLQEDRFLISSQNPDGITKEDLEQLAEWARNQIPANREDNQVEDSE
jgi:hypothetical protein